REREVDLVVALRRLRPGPAHRADGAAARAEGDDQDRVDADGAGSVVERLLGSDGVELRLARLEDVHHALGRVTARRELGDRRARERLLLRVAMRDRYE